MLPSNQIAVWAHRDAQDEHRKSCRLQRCQGHFIFAMESVSSLYDGPQNQLYKRISSNTTFFTHESNQKTGWSRISEAREHHENHRLSAGSNSACRRPDTSRTLCCSAQCRVISFASQIDQIAMLLNVIFSDKFVCRMMDFGER